MRSLDSMKWTQLKQKDTFVENSMITNGLNGDFYEGNLITFGNVLEDDVESEADPNAKPMLCWWNIGMNGL